MAFTFGGSGAAPSTGGGLSFGGSAAAPSTGGGLSFGASAPAAGGGGLSFGSAPAAATAPAAAGGLSFGAPPAPAPGGLSFGAAPAPAAGGLSFGAAPAPAAGGSLFPGGGSSLLGGAGQPQGAANGTAVFVTDSTSFAQLPKQFKDRCVDLEKHIREQESLRDTVREQLASVSRGAKLHISSLSQKLVALETEIERQTTNIQSFKEMVRRELKNGELAERMYYRFRSGGRQGLQLAGAQVPSKYDVEKVHDFYERMRHIRAQIDDIDRYLATSMHQNSRANPRALQDVLQSQHDALLSITARIARSHDSAEDLRDHFRALRAKQHKDTKDPFREENTKRSFEPPGQQRRQPEQPRPQQQQQQQQQQQLQQQQNLLTQPSAQPLFSLTGGALAAGRATAPATSSSFSLGGSVAPATGSALSFGGAAPATGGGLSFGGAAPATGGGLSFGGAAAPATGGGLSFGGAAAQSKPPAFGF